MAIARGIMQVGRINVYPTASSFVSITPAADFAVCGDLITFVVKVENLKSPFTPTPDGYVSVIDIATNTIIGTGALDGTGHATITSVLQNGVLWLVVKYNGHVNGFKPSQSAISPFYVTFQTSVTSISSPAVDGYYCPDQNSAITSFVHLSGNPSVYPVGGIVEFALYTDNTHFIQLPSAAVSASGHATSYIPAFTTGSPGTPGDGYYLQASFDGYECFAKSNSAAGISGSKVIPVRNDTTTTAITVPAATICYSAITYASITVTGTLFGNPSSGTVIIKDSVSGTILGSQTPINGVAVIELDGYMLPQFSSAINYPHVYQIWADYVPDGYCYAASSYHLDIGNLLTLNKNFASAHAPTQAVGELPDRLHTLAFTMDGVIVGTGTAAEGLHGTYVFKLYSVSTGNLVLTFGSQSVSVLATSTTASGIIPANTMTNTDTYYVIGIYTPDGTGCYDTTVSTSSHSVTLTPA